MHNVLTAALASLGVSASAWAGQQTEPFAGLLCFQHITPGDLMIGSTKVVGSAQRRQRGALMQHGSVLLVTSPYAPVLPGIDALSGNRLSPEDTCWSIKDRFAEATGWTLSQGDWSEQERVRIEEMVQDKYCRDSWNWKR
jgi:lipoate-protein ligase A